ncbi:MAG: TonB-dependent receptor [Acidobacteriota bacterium]
MRSVRVSFVACLLFSALTLFAQTDRSTITGTVVDPAGAVIPNAAIDVRNPANGAVFTVGTSATGNYVVSVPAGTYDLSVTVTGFKKYTRTGILVNAATSVRQDITLAVGATSDTITVVDTTPLIKTESAEMSTVVTSDQANVLPVLTIGTGGGFGSIRNPLAVTSLLPGVQYSSNFNLRVNGLPSNTGTIRVEGQDASNGIWRQITDINQQGQEAIQEVAIQTSNYAAEFGQAAGGYFNFTMKSGTNKIHGSVYDYFVNEFMNAGTPHTNYATAANPDGAKAGQHVRNRQRRNDYGFTIGGPIAIPKIYDGHDKSFFFFNWEQFRETQSVVNALQTVPTAAYRLGDFTTAQPLCSAVTAAAACPNGVGGGQIVLQSGVAARDQLGRVIPVGGVYDPLSNFTAPDGSLARNLFPLFKVPLANMDPISLKVQALLPLPNSTDPTRQLINNYNVPAYSNQKVTSNPSLKIDHNLSPTIKLSGYFSQQLTTNPNHNGLNELLTAVAPTNNKSTTIRVNYDQTLAPTVLLHVGVGYLHTYNPAKTPEYDPATLGLVGYDNGAFPNFTGLLGGNSTGGNGIGIGAGAFSNYQQWDQKPTANANLTWVKGNHTLKFGGEAMTDGVINKTRQRANGNFSFGSAQTQNVWENGKASISGNSGFPYASFLLGQAQSLVASATGTMRLGNHGIGLYAQDTWKASRKLTVDFGLRYDFQTYLKEQYGRMQNADFETVNTLVNRKGTVKYEGNCKCNFSNNYPLAFGPRIGVAYQLDSKTVIRGGAALQYGTTSNNSQLSLSILDFYTFNAPGFGQNALQGGLAGGNPYRPGNPYGNAPIVFPDFNPNKYPIRTVCAGTLNTTCYTPQSPFISIDDDSRPPRIFQYDITVQREVIRNLVVEVAYVGNRGAWFTAPALNTTNFNALRPADVARMGFDLNLLSDRTLLTSPIGSTITQTLNAGVIQKGLGVPYQGFPLGQNLVTALIPRPQWGATIPPFLGPPLGRTWYDSLQVKVTKRYSHGLDMQGSFTYGKELSMGANSDTGYLGVPATTRINDVFNRAQNKQISPLSQPFRVVISGTYTTPRMSASNMASRLTSQVLRDWQIGAVLQYQSGQLIQVPNSNNALFSQLNLGGGLFSGASTYYNFASGKDGNYWKSNFDPNCIGQCLDPTRSLVASPSTWVDAGPGQYGVTAAYYNNYRWQRQPSENFNFGRNFRVGKEGRMNLNVRAEFQNILNRHFYGQPSLGNPNTLAANNNPGGALSAGYGFVNTLNGAGSRPRTGLLVGRFTF